MATDVRSDPPRGAWTAAWAVALTSAGGAALGLVLAGSRTGSAGGCSAAARHLGACHTGSLAAAKPYVTAGLIGLLLGALIAIAAVLVWREVRAAVILAHRSTGPLRRPAPGPHTGAHRGALAPRVRP
ncbi:MAG: hypothetical protein ACR2KV_08140 [Solirubrobacteraceae bacterium]